MSIPTCINTSRPSCARKVRACPAAWTETISPSQPATSIASVGSMERPSPTIFCAKTGSGTRSSGQTWPDNGDRILSCDIPGRLSSAESPPGGDAVSEMRTEYRPGSFFPGISDVRTAVEAGTTENLELMNAVWILITQAHDATGSGTYAPDSQANESIPSPAHLPLLGHIALYQALSESSNSFASSSGPAGRGESLVTRC